VTYLKNSGRRSIPAANPPEMPAAVRSIIAVGFEGAQSGAVSSRFFHASSNPQGSKHSQGMVVAYALILSASRVGTSETESKMPKLPAKINRARRSERARKISATEPIILDKYTNVSARTLLMKSNGDSPE
jgi:hypothetical protein